MRVLWLSHVIPYPPKAGVLLRAYHLLRGVAARHDVDLVAFVQRPLLATFYDDVEQGLEACYAELASLCRSVRFLPIEKNIRPFGQLRTAAESLFSSEGYMAGWLDSDSARQVLAEVCAARKYDLMHCDSLSLARFRSLFPDTPATLGHHNAESHMMNRRAIRERVLLKRWYFYLESRRIARYEATIAERFALHISCSELDSERLRATMPAAKLVAVPNGVDIDYFASGAAIQRSDSLIFVGTLNWYPNIDAMMFLLQQIWPLLRKRVPNVTLDLVGAGAPAELVDIAKASPGVQLHGFVDDVRPLIERAAIYVCPIRDGGGTKLKILDALSMAKCIVAHPVSCEGINVTPGKTVMYAESPTEFVNTIEALLRDPERRQSIGRAARDLAEDRYSFDRIGKQFTELLEGVVRGKE